MMVYFHGIEWDINMNLLGGVLSDLYLTGV